MDICHEISRIAVKQQARRTDNIPILRRKRTRSLTPVEQQTDEIVQACKKRHEEDQQITPPENYSSSSTSFLVTPEPSPENMIGVPQFCSRHGVGIPAYVRAPNFDSDDTDVRSTPIPKLTWANNHELWQNMLKKDLKYTRDHSYLTRHVTLKPRMRAILLDWLIEVCEVYRLHRETYYLAQDFIDRFLSTQKNIIKQQLQLIGITGLFIAAKLEEIYPPKLPEFSYVTDGACTEKEILTMELIMLKGLKWFLSPVTPNSWLNCFLQIANQQGFGNSSSFLYPQYSQYAFIQIARLIDLCTMDFGSLQFSYSVLAASALYHLSSESVALSVSGLRRNDIAACVQWMTPFALTIREMGAIELQKFNNVSLEDVHNIQTHTIDLKVYERALHRQTELLSYSRSSPVLSEHITPFLTPPKSIEKKETIV